MYWKKLRYNASIPTPSGSLGRLVGPSLGEKVDQETFVFSGVKGAASPSLGREGGTPNGHRGFPEQYWIDVFYRAHFSALFRRPANAPELMKWKRSGEG